MIGHTLLVAGAVAVCLALTSGCAPAENESSNELGTARSAFQSANSLDANALDATVLYPAALTPAMLAAAALDPGSFDGAVLAALADPGLGGTVSRQLLSYAVGCALGPDQSFDLPWVDGSKVTHDETYVGSIALATDWSASELGATEQAWVSACLIARVNHYGIEVPLSLRGGDAPLATTPAELDAFTYEEGAFWGNVFAASPTAYACAYGPDDTHSEGAWRVCATGMDGTGATFNCGIIQPLGACSTLCAGLTGSSGQYYPGCGASPITSPIDTATLTSEVITVFLQ
jgi:hypothetical protein